MSNNVVSLPFEDFAVADAEVELITRRNAIQDYMGDITEWCEKQGVDVGTNEFKHQAAVIMTQLQIIMMGVK